MNLKTFLILIASIILCVTFYIVYTNRASEKILTNFITVFVVGAIGVLATSLVSLKEEKLVETYPSCIFLRKKPLLLMNYGIRNFKYNRTVPLIATNNSINYILKKDSTTFETLFDSPEKGKVIINDLFVRYIFDLLETRYKTGWYLRSYALKVPGGFSATSWPVEQMPYTVFNTSKLNSIFTSNPFIKTGLFQNSTDESQNIDFKIKFPEKTEILYKNDSEDSFLIEIDNSFVNIELRFRIAISMQNIDDEVAQAYNIRKSEEGNYIFIPFLIETTTKYKKFKNGHPDMDKYKYWTNDLLSFLKTNISLDEFWKQIEDNKPLEIKSQDQ